MTLPRSITVPAAIILAAASAACMVLTSLSASTEPASPNLDIRRGLKVSLRPSREVIQYGMDPKTVRKRPRRGAETSWWKDINYGQNGLCGGEKCFFISTTDPSRGYLVGDSSFHGVPRLAEAVEAYTYAAELESKYDIRHLYVDPPYEMDTPPLFMRNLSAPYMKHFGTPKKMIIQPSRTAPEGSIIIRCYNHNVLYKRTETIVRNMSGNAKKNLVKELEIQNHVVEDNPGLINDFQLMIDKEGRTYHLDLNRAKNHVSRRDRVYFKGCLEGAIKCVEDPAFCRESNQFPEEQLAPSVQAENLLVTIESVLEKSGLESNQLPEKYEEYQLPEVSQ